jgi:hypothetical protein
MHYPEPERGRGKKDESIKGAESAGFSYRRLADARMVLRYASDLAQRVMTRLMNFDEALEAAKI